MRIQLRYLFSSLILMSIIAAHPAALQAVSQTLGSPPPSPSLAGRWRVTFAFPGNKEKHLVFDSSDKGSGSFLLLDAGPDDKPVLSPLPAVWSQLANDRVSFSGDVELPLGTCCRELGTLIFKGSFKTNNSISGKSIFVTSIDEEESPYKFRSLVGTFTATRVL
jgi:hypothetical protein